MKILIDTNILLDVLLHRIPFYDESRTISELVEQRRIDASISSSAMTDIYYSQWGLIPRPLGRLIFCNTCKLMGSKLHSTNNFLTDRTSSDSVTLT